MKKQLDRSNRYNFSDIPKEMEEKVLEVIKNSSKMPWDIVGFNINRKNGSLRFERNDWYFQSNFGKNDLTFESLLDLEDVQVDCRGLTDEQIEDMASVFEANGYYVDKKQLSVDGKYCYLCFVQYDVWVCNEFISKHTITYEKFMELFAPQYDVTMIVEAPKTQFPTSAKCVQDSKASLVEQLRSLEETRQKVSREILEIEKQLKEREKVLMFMVKKGVPTFAFHNSSQRYNLIQNGWKEVSKEGLIKEFEKYD